MDGGGGILANAVACACPAWHDGREQLKFEAAETICSRLTAGDEDYVPRGSAYLQMLSRALAHGSE